MWKGTTSAKNLQSLKAHIQDAAATQCSTTAIEKQNNSSKWGQRLSLEKK
jgi:hypothetical protein